MRTEGTTSPTRSSGYRTPCTACPLRNLNCFRDFGQNELAFVNDFKRGELAVDPGAVIVQEGTASPHLYTVLDGWAFRYKTLPDGRRQILNYALPGDFIGLQTSVFDLMDHGVEALTSMVLCLFPRDELMTLFERQPSLAYDVTWLSAHQERLLDAQLLTVGRRNALERAAFVVWHLFHRARQLGRADKGRIAFPITQQHLADTLGLSLVHTNKTLKRLRMSDTIRWSERWLEVHDEERLMALAKVEALEDRPRPLL
ncbi:Crp/Fnr family transcriptional regulator [Amorphus sp. 3PC139-8]|uniref:Crp/Fnr family transcriptional regulator n=1 Tax=Amorphus sp. 3PC139-8 TaxID=2735676 RepID=UPI00345D0D1D